MSSSFEPSSMYKLTVLNMTTASIDKTDTMLRMALIFEWVLLMCALVETSLLWYLLRYTKQYHRNLSMVVEQLANQYFVSIFARMFMIYMQLMIPDTEELLTDPYFLFACWLRNSLLFVAFYFSAFPVFERVFATIFVFDYETNKRRWVSYLLSFILYFISFLSAQLFMFFDYYREVHIIMITIVNLFAFFMTLIIERYNKNKYQKLRATNDSRYSLSARTQLSENINATKPFKAMCFSISFFSLVCTSMLHVDEYTDSPIIRNWVYLAFNYCCWSYGTVVPIFMLFYNQGWKKELRRLKHKIFCSHRQISSESGSNNTSRQMSKVRDTFGNNCFVANEEHGDVYFSRLQTEWAGPSTNELAPRRSTMSVRKISAPTNSLSPRE